MENKNIQMSQNKEQAMSGEDAYFGLRKKCLNLKAENIIMGYDAEKNPSYLRLDADNQVYGAIVDMVIGGGIRASLWCCFDGMVSLFDERGTGVMGISKKYGSVKLAGLQFLYNSGRCLSKFEKAASFELPYDGRHIVHLLTRKGVYKAFINPEKLEEASQELRFVFSLYNKVMAEIANSGKDVPNE